jgi:hypothetical protein
MLARSLNSMPVSPIYSASPSIAYGKTRLETCIQAINRARYSTYLSFYITYIYTFIEFSPELFNDEEDDYSLYLLDPLEAQQTTSVSTSGAQSQVAGVAVGLGLLSTLSAPNPSQETVFVTGTVSMGPAGAESLEVIFNLREVQAFSDIYTSFTYKFNVIDEAQIEVVC